MYVSLEFYVNGKRVTRFYCYVLLTYWTNIFFIFQIILILKSVNKKLYVFVNGTTKCGVVMGHTVSMLVHDTNI